MACEDNTWVYKFHLKDGQDVSIEFECQWLVLGRNRYTVKAN